MKSETPPIPADEFAISLEAMTEDEVYSQMSSLEETSETDDENQRIGALAKITLVQNEIERRHPGQLLAPYQRWKAERL